MHCSEYLHLLNSRGVTGTSTEREGETSVSVVNRMFRSLSIRNYRLYFFGQLVSSLGTWMQTIAQAWLVLRLSHNSGSALGIVTALQFTPTLVLGAWSGVVADRGDKRRLLLVTQSAMAILAAALGLITISGVASLWHVYALSLLTGVATAVDGPIRSSFASEMVEPADLSNAIGLNSAVMNGARMIGPGIAGVIIALWDVGPCFVANAVSFLAVIAALVMIHPDQLHPSPPVQRAKGQVREGLAYAWRTPELRSILCLMTVVGLVTFGNFSIIGPLLAKLAFHGDAGTYGIMSSTIGFGSLLGSLAIATQPRPSLGLVLGTCVSFGVLILLTAVSPTLTIALPLLALLGAAMMMFLSAVTSTLQLVAIPSMRGRVMALWTVLIMGTTPIGGPIVGYVAQRFGPRVAYGQGGVAAIIAGLVAGFVLMRTRRRARPRVL